MTWARSESTKLEFGVCTTHVNLYLNDIAKIEDYKHFIGLGSSDWGVIYITYKHGGSIRVEFTSKDHADYVRGHLLLEVEEDEQ